jgi:hypothetical protein
LRIDPKECREMSRQQMRIVIIFYIIFVVSHFAPSFWSLHVASRPFPLP